MSIAKNNIELLAPAGNFECLTAAVQNGADAVYFAGKNFGARSFADNFDKETLKKAIDYCHLRNVKTHITVNTALNDSELEAALDFVAFLHSEGAEALIVSDIGLASQIKKAFPNISIHASTQMTIHNTDGVKFAQNAGFDRVVLSRELSCNDIRTITSNTDVEIEIFVHGALCMCYSGQCLLSSVIGGRSGNRGSCAQPCRLAFSSDSIDRKFLLSLKDMSLANHINEIKKLNVASLKIEGRMKGPAYVAAVTSIYRKYLDSDIPLSETDKNILEQIFFRGGLTDGYFTGKKGKIMFDFEKPDNPYLKQTKEIIRQYDKNYTEINDKKTDIDLSFTARNESYPEVVLEHGDFISKYVHTNLTQVALTNPTSSDIVKNQLAKTGGTPYNFSKVSVDIENGLFFSKSELNQIRRNALEKFEKEFLDSFKNKNNTFDFKKADFSCDFSSTYTVYVSDLIQLDTVLEFDFERIYVPLNLFDDIDLTEKNYLSRIVVSLPEIVKDSEKEEIDRKLDKIFKLGINKLLIHNYGQISYCEKFELILSHRFNIWNSSAAEYFKKYIPVSIVVSPELSLKSITDIKNVIQCESIVYGHLPVMITENCIVKNMKSCPCDKNSFYYITDRKGVSFPVKGDKNTCRSILYNSVPIYLADKINNLSGFNSVVKQLFFTVESQYECRKICEDYMFNSRIDLPDSYTRGYSLK